MEQLVDGELAVEDVPADQIPALLHLLRADDLSRELIIQEGAVPSALAAGQPKSFSAAEFQATTTPSARVATVARGKASKSQRTSSWSTWVFA